MRKELSQTLGANITLANIKFLENPLKRVNSSDTARQTGVFISTSFRYNVAQNRLLNNVLPP